MNVLCPNEVKIYCLSAGKTLPEWLNERKRRRLQNADTELQRRITLIQDFDMPSVSNNISVTPDGNFVLATGVYKPRFKCFDLNQLSLKFERCLDNEVLSFQSLSDDYSKVVFLQTERYIEFHAQYGRYYRTRVPAHGRDLQYHWPSCDLYIFGVSSDIFRLNLVQGRFLQSLTSDAQEINCGRFNPVHQLFVCGTNDGRMLAFDPRCRKQVTELDCNSIIAPLECNSRYSLTSLEFKDHINLGIGTSDGQVLLFDIRSQRPYMCKDHRYGLPIRNIHFNSIYSDLVLSMDRKILKIWERNGGKMLTSIEPGTLLNNLCCFPNSGLLFMANESPKMLSYFIPSLGPAPKWCSFLDNLTEELEESDQPTIYDDYQFVTRDELTKLGLEHLIGTDLLRAYMHGYFMDIRLYKKAQSIAEPFSYDNYRKQKIKEAIDKSRASRIKAASQLPAVNRSLAERLSASKKLKPLLEDDRFQRMFVDKNFEIDAELDAQRYRDRKSVGQRVSVADNVTPIVANGDDSDESEKPEESDDWAASSDESSSAAASDRDEARGGGSSRPQRAARQPQLVSLRQAMEQRHRTLDVPIAERLNAAAPVAVGPRGRRQMTFTLAARGRKRPPPDAPLADVQPTHDAPAHERRASAARPSRRSAAHLRSKRPAKH